jgi:cation diffusion facilitator family transporter
VNDPAVGRTAGVRAARTGLLVNAGLAVGKGVAGVVGHSFALVADAVESLADILGSLVVWGGLRLSLQAADDEHPWGHGKAEPIAAAIVGAMLLFAGGGIVVQAVRWGLVPHAVPAPWTLGVIAVVVVLKETLFRRVHDVAEALGSSAVAADAWHHRADAISSLAAFVGIGIAVLGGAAWYWADEAAAVIAGGMIGVNGWRIVQPALHELMDGSPDGTLLEQVGAAATAVPGVCCIEKLMARKVGTRYFVDMHVQANPAMSLHEAHLLSGIVKSAIRRAVPQVENVLIHMEPFEEATAAAPGRGDG